MQYDFSVVSKFRNKKQVDIFIDKIREKGYTCFNFASTPVDKNNPNGSPEEQMRAYESTKDFLNDPYSKFLFEKDLEGLKKAKSVILLLPAGTSAHIEIGIAYGLGKKCILVGEPEKPETLYFLFNERYKNIDEFLDSI
jgi:hypothetical protein